MHAPVRARRPRVREASGLLTLLRLLSLQQPTHPVYNIGPDKVIQATTHFLQKPVPGSEEFKDEVSAEPATV